MNKPTDEKLFVVHMTRKQMEMVHSLIESSNFKSGDEIRQIVDLDNRLFQHLFKAGE